MAPPRDKANLAAFRHGIDDVAIIQQMGLQGPGICAGGRIGQKRASSRTFAYRLRSAVRQDFAEMENDDLAAALGFIEVGRAEEHAQALFIDELEHDLPQFAARMGSTPTVGSSSNSNAGARTRVHARPSFCFMPPESRPASRPVKGPSPVMCRSLV